MNLTIASWELLGLWRQLDELLNLLATPAGQNATAWAPPVDLIELPDRYAVRIDVPGVAAADLRVTFANHRLRVAGRRIARSSRHAGARCHRAERNHGGFYLEIRVPPGVVRELAQARLHNGVLEVNLPRCANDSQPIVIPVVAEEP